MTWRRKWLSATKAAIKRSPVQRFVEPAHPPIAGTLKTFPVCTFGMREISSHIFNNDIRDYSFPKSINAVL
jgi:hypothetical protein